MNLRRCVLIVVLFCASVGCWDTEELEIFDLVEEVDTNFYSLLDVPQDADAAVIRKAYRRLSLQIHPDKNDAPDAEIKFRQLVAVYEVLRDQRKRALYDRVLENGLPDWKHAVYYYRRVRKMGLAEMSFILFVIVTVGQYIVAWAAYLEKKYTAQQFLEAKLKRLQKKQKKGKYDGPALPDTIVLEIPSPRVWDTLPFQLPRMLWFVLTLCPQSVLLIKNMLARRQQRKEEDTAESEEEDEEPVMQVREVAARGPRRRKPKFAPPEVLAAEDELPHDLSTAQSSGSVDDLSAQEEDTVAPYISGGLWTDDDLAELSRQLKRYPQGTPQRWEKVAAAMHRPAAEVAHMAKKVKEEGYRPPQVTTEELPRKTKTRAAESPLPAASEWSQPQQKALENALTKFPKGGSGDRWEKIAKCVPGKTKEECMYRYRQLVELVKKKKENTAECVPMAEP
ncbi:dnaJ homolog subfamily C member 1 [Schistocerca cancellata]|uniref:dnaJ homolog subfamily C member 1 n=1 Tax=Schistocerca cancellata TaxID=274614 RepID=UPI0021178F02|nr:dnaJ homolog subfamily C member 1 [Schistocerca cancellata]